ncbi:hypothetical protein EYF80_036507 [Xyrichtys novacula]|uniref:Uncharacterized protein n=1 Tax=Xyrichtys novacula TaxID=13765 RepID=A0AAV1G5U9_XYRNO|nr:hypothetical protein EYF80_036507 [Xyrichtys novacula]
MHRSPRFGLMAPLGPTYRCWSDGPLCYQAAGPAACFHIHFNLALSKTLNDFPKIGRGELNREGEECEVRKGETKGCLECGGARRSICWFNALITDPLSWPQKGPSIYNELQNGDKDKEAGFHEAVAVKECLPATL